MKQVFWNLCNNALRAMPEGGVLTVGLDAGPDTGANFHPRHRNRHRPPRVGPDF